MDAMFPIGLHFLNKKIRLSSLKFNSRREGIEPTFPASETSVLPLHHLLIFSRINYHIFLAITAHRKFKSFLISWIVFANSERVEPVVVTSSTNKTVAQFGNWDKSSTWNTHFRFFFLSSRFKRNCETV